MEGEPRGLKRRRTKAIIIISVKRTILTLSFGWQSLSQFLRMVNSKEDFKLNSLLNLFIGFPIETMPASLEMVFRRYLEIAAFLVHKRCQWGDNIYISHLFASISPRLTRYTERKSRISGSATFIPPPPIQSSIQIKRRNCCSFLCICSSTCS